MDLSVVRPTAVVRQLDVFCPARILEDWRGRCYNGDTSVERPHAHETVAPLGDVQRSGVEGARRDRTGLASPLWPRFCVGWSRENGARNDSRRHM